MSCRKRRRWHLRDPKCKHFLGEHAPRLPRVWGAFGAQTFLPLRAPSKPHATLSTTRFSWLTKSMPKDGKRDSCSRRSWRGGGGCILKIVIAKGVLFSYVIIIIIIFFSWGGGKVLIHRTSRNTPGEEHCVTTHKTAAELKETTKYMRIFNSYSSSPNGP